MRGIVLLAEVFGDSAGFLDDEIAVFESGDFAQWCWNLLAELRWREAVGGAFSGDEGVREGESGEEPCNADGTPRSSGSRGLYLGTRTW